jgi:hypothetical protein
MSIDPNGRSARAAPRVERGCQATPSSDDAEAEVKEK